MKLGILSPSNSEIAAFLEKVGNKKEEKAAMMRLITGEFEGHEVFIGISGVCKVNAALCATLLIERKKIDTLILTGVAGAIDASLLIGDTVIATEIAYHDVNNAFLAVDVDPPYLEGDWMPSDKTLIEKAKAALGDFYADHRVYYGKCVTGEAFIEDDGRDAIIEKLDPLCTDMETASAAHIARCYGIPYIAIRSITDTPNDSGFATFKENFLTSSAVEQECLAALIRELYK